MIGYSVSSTSQSLSSRHESSSSLSSTASACVIMVTRCGDTGANAGLRG